MKLKDHVKSIFVACDHGGLSLKKAILEKFSDLPFEDLGTNTVDSVDYPDFADLVVQKVDENHCGLLICGSGQGMAMRANKYAHIRAALCWSTEVAELSRQHNDANVLCMGARVLDEKLALEIFKTFMNTEFEGGRHQARVEKLAKGV